MYDSEGKQDAKMNIKEDFTTSGRRTYTKTQKKQTYLSGIDILDWIVPGPWKCPFPYRA